MFKSRCQMKHIFVCRLGAESQHTNECSTLLFYSVFADILLNRLPIMPIFFENMFSRNSQNWSRKNVPRSVED